MSIYEKSAFEVLEETVADINDSYDHLRAFDMSKLDKIKDKYKSMIADLQRRINRLESIYGNKFGKIDNNSSSITSDSEAEKVKSYLFNEKICNILFNEEHGIFSRRPKIEDYTQYIMSSKALEKYLYSKIEAIDTYLKYCSMLPSVQEACVNEVQHDTSEFSGCIYVGDMREPFEFSLKLELLESQGIIKQDWIYRPFSYRIESPFIVLIKNYSDSADTDNSKLLKNIIYRTISGSKEYSHTFSYYDQDGGKNLGALGDLNDIVNYNAYFLNERLFNHTFRQMELCTTKQEISDSLKSLEAYVAIVNRLCGDFSNLSEYNNACDNGIINSGKIPFKMILFENILGATEDGEILKKIINNSQRCGISLVLAADMKSRKNNNLFDVLDSIEGIDVIEITDKGSSITYHTQNSNEELSYVFDPAYLDAVSSSFISDLFKKLNPKLELETRFEKLFDLDSFWKKDGAKGIVLPVAVNLEGKIENLVLGTSEYPFGMLAGHAGCGKSSFLHTVISSVVSNYHPEDVQLWLSDYKLIEFAQYTDNAPPHIRFVGLANTKEYTLSFIDKIFAEQNRRADLFGKITSVEDYRNTNGAHSMPRLLIVIDEFHVMSDHIADEPEYKNKLTRIFKEARAFGITMLLSDQTCGVGLKGLDDPAKKQIQNRIAMQTDPEEQKAIFEVNRLDEIPQVQIHEAVMRYRKEIIDENGLPDVVYIYTRCKTVYTSTEIRKQLSEKSITLAEQQNVRLPAPDVVIIKPRKADFDDISSEILKRTSNDSRGVLAYVGTPNGMDKYFNFRISDAYTENVMCIGKNEAQLKSILYHIMYCVMKQTSELEVKVIADENCDLYIYLEKYLMGLKEKLSNFEIITDYSDICKTIALAISEKNARSRRRGFKKPLYIIWIGLEMISRVLSNYPDVRPNYGIDIEAHEEPKSSQIDLLKEMYENVMGDDLNKSKLQSASHEDSLNSAEDSNYNRLYNASSDIKSLFLEGGPCGFHSLVFYKSVAELRMTKCSLPEYFRHKIAFTMSTDDAMQYLRAANLIKDAEGRLIGKDVAVYDGGTVDMKFMPFLLEEEI